MLKFIEFEKAIEILLSQNVTLKKEKVMLHDALGRVLVDDIHAEFSMPPFDKSPYDGYAVIAADTEGASKENPVKLRVLGEIPAGTPAENSLAHGTAVKILTGAPVPVGADATIKFEDVEINGDEISLFESVKHNSNVVLEGENYYKGDILVSAGTRITPPQLAIIATQGISEVEVYRKPKATVISTGTELVEVGEKCSDAQIYSSNYFALYGYLQEMGFDVFNGGIAVDDLDVISQALKDGLEKSDVVVTTGGASVGDYDFAVRGAESVGADSLFWKVFLKPGGAILAAKKEDKMILSLSGNPGAAMMGFLMVTAPYLRKMCGRADVKSETINLPLMYPVKKTSKVNRMLRGHFEFKDGNAFFAENEGKGNGDMFAYVNCELIAEIAPNDEPLAAGTIIRAFRLTKSINL